MRASRRDAAAHGDAFTPPPQLHTLITPSDPEGNKVRSVDSPHSSRIHHTVVERSRGARETRLRPDAHTASLRAPRTGARERDVVVSEAAAAKRGLVVVARPPR
eukprot:4347679-Prymnesium_polylepis.1